MIFEEPVLAVYAGSEEAKQKLEEEGKDILFFSGSDYILPSGEIFVPEEKCAGRMKELRDFDVVELYSDRQFYVFYSDNSNDNALMLTTKCNSSCIMCPMSESMRKGPVYETTEHLLRLIELFPTDAPFLTITGGEPTLIKEDMFVILDALKNHFEGTKFFLLTNGRTLSNRKYRERFLSAMPENLRFCIPLYGHDEITHDTITQTPGSFRQTVEALHELLKAGCETEIRIVVSRLNAYRMDELCDYIAKHFKGTAVINIMAAEMCGAAVTNKEKVWLDYAECFQCSKRGIRHLMKNGIDVRLYNFPLCKTDREYWSLCEKSITDYKIRYSDDCGRCAVKEICGGVFGTTLGVTKMKLNPIGE